MFYVHAQMSDEAILLGRWKRVTQSSLFCYITTW